MRAPRSAVGMLGATPVVRNAWPRRAIVAALLAICAVLTFFPERYRAAVSPTPSDPISIGIGGALGQLGAINSVFGNQAAVEVSIKVARSEYVRSIIARQLKLEQRLGKSPVQVHRQTEQKRALLLKLFQDSADRLAAARTAYDTFRLTTRYSSPQAAFYAAGDRIPQLEAEIRLKQAELNAMREFATDENIRVRQLVAGIEALRHQLATAKSTSPWAQSSVGQVVRQTTQAERLTRELQVAQARYDTYRRSLQGTSVEDLTAGVSIRVLEPAFVDSDRQLNMVPLGAGILTLLLALALALEFHAPRPPLQRARDEVAPA